MTIDTPKHLRLTKQEKERLEKVVHKIWNKRKFKDTTEMQCFMFAIQSDVNCVTAIRAIQQRNDWINSKRGKK